MVGVGWSAVIGIRNESSLHARLKEYYCEQGDEVEGNVAGYIIDVIKPDQLVEIQTANFSAIKKKLADLLTEHSIRLVYPIPLERQLVHIAPETGELLETRKSPKKGTIYDLFSELIRIPHLLTHPKLTLEALFIVEQEIRCADGKGSWRRRGVSIVDRRLVEVVEGQRFKTAEDYLSVLPEDLPKPFTNKEVAASCKIRVPQARKVTYALKKAGFLIEVGKRGNEILHERAV